MTSSIHSTSISYRRFKNILYSIHNTDQELQKYKTDIFAVVLIKATGAYSSSNRISVNSVNSVVNDKEPYVKTARRFSKKTLEHLSKLQWKLTGSGVSTETAYLYLDTKTNFLYSGLPKELKSLFFDSKVTALKKRLTPFMEIDHDPFLKKAQMSHLAAQLILKGREQQDLLSYLDQLLGVLVYRKDKILYLRPNEVIQAVKVLQVSKKSGSVVDTKLTRLFCTKAPVRSLKKNLTLTTNSIRQPLLQLSRILKAYIS